MHRLRTVRSNRPLSQFLEKDRLNDFDNCHTT
ncbi:hypothetical protein FB480_101854 [Agrobacterium vitis]|nr:hypothetical protein FB480_101854 [Agrobacterium vitis]